MFQLDDNFLRDLGITDLPEDQKKALLRHIYEELELRVGERLAEGMSESQMTEFETLLDRDEEKTRQWLQDNAPEYKQSDDYKQFVTNLGLDVEQDLGADRLADYVATKWLEVNRPDYREVVARTMEELKMELIQGRDTILAAAPPRE